MLDTKLPDHASTLIQIPSLPQIVPSQACFSCDGCCRFPDVDSVLRPYFTREEIGRAIECGIDPVHFPDRDGGQVRPVRASLGFRLINTMDAFGLPGVARAKQAYRPVALVPSYVGMEP